MLTGAKALVRLILCLLATSLLLASCHKLLGNEYEVDVGGPGPTTITGDCRTGEWKCNREYLLECTAAGKWEQRRICDTANQCDPTAKTCTVCSQAGLRRCNGQTREVCAVDRGSWTELQQCASADQCSPTHCGPCTTGELQCVGETSTELQVCNADNRWQPVMTCDTAPLCAASVAMGMEYPGTTPACLPPVCEAGSLSCDGSSLYRCRQGREALEQVQICASPALCLRASQNGATGDDMCAPTCPVGGFRCNGTSAEQCSSDQTEWVNVATCTADRPCDSTTGQCGPPCELGTHRCNVESLEVCTSDGNWAPKETCATAQLCSAPTGSCGPPVCLVGQQQCNPADPRVLERCNEGRTGFDLVTTCQTAALCGCAMNGSCAGGLEPSGCGTPVCMPQLLTGELPLRCNPAAPLEVQSCDASLNGWNPVTTCLADEFCYTQDRVDPCKDECPAATFCNGAELLNCGSAGPMHQADCATPTLCDCAVAGTCAAGQSAANGCGIPLCGGNLPSYACDGGTLQSCQVGRNGWDRTPCGAPPDPALCYPGAAAVAGYCAVCPIAGVISCTDNDTGIHTCSTDRKGYVQEMSCALGCLERPGPSADYCPVCSPNELRCNGTAPGTSRVRQCTADQTGFTDVGSLCTSGCLDLGLADACAACQANELRCDGTQLLRCNASRTALTVDRTCSPSCIDSGIADHCGSCVVGSRQCNGANTRLLTCGSNGEFDAGAACDFGCIPKTGDDACAPTCAPGTYRCATGTGGPNGNRLEVCNANGDGWTLEATCGAGLCDATGEECNDCTAGQFSCSAGTLRDCDDSGHWRTAVNNCQGNTLVRTCSGNTLNEVACGASQTCDEAGNDCNDCSGTAFSCSAGTLRQCNGTGQWASTAGTNCFGGDLYTCGGTGNNTVLIEDACPICDDANNQCDDCTPGNFGCLAGVVQLCDSTGHYMPTSACSGGMMRTCTGAGGTTLTTMACTSPTTSCNTAGTACGMCSDGDDRCQSMGSSVLQTCTGGVWVTSPESPCDEGCFGTAPNAYCGECSSGSRCDGNQPQTCTQGEWVDAPAACTGSTPVCLNATCVGCAAGQMPACGPANPVCLNNSCVECATGQTAACTGTTPVCLNNECVECMPPAVDCMGTQPRECVGGEWEDNGAACTGATPMCTGGACVCMTGALRCSPTTDQPQICTAGAWVANGMACTGQTPMCTGGACVCMTGALRCSPTGEPQICTAGAWVANGTCPVMTPACDAGACVECADDTDCEEDVEVCDTMNECVPAG